MPRSTRRSTCGPASMATADRLGHRCRAGDAMIEVDQRELTLTVRDSALFAAAWLTVSSLGIGSVTKEGESLRIRCDNASDFSLLATMLDAPATW